MMHRKGRTTLVIAVVMGISISLMGRAFSGVVIARLPFVPFKIFQNVTHYGLPGNDERECGMTFVFLLANVSVA